MEDMAIVSIAHSNLLEDPLLKNTGDTNNKNEDNPAQATETLSGVGTVARKASTSTDINNNSTRDRVWGDTHTEPTPSHNSN